MPQERYNTEWVTENECGVVLKSFDEIDGAVQHLLEGPTLERLRGNVSKHKNRAVYEAVEILAKLMNGPAARHVEGNVREFSRTSS